MFGLEGIALIVFYVLLIILAWKLFKTVLKVAISVIIFTVALVLVGGYLINADVNSFQEDLNDGTMVLLSNSEGLRAGYLMVNGEAQPYTQERLTELTNQYAGDEYDEMLADQKRLFVVSMDAVRNIDDLSISTEEYNLTSNTVLSALSSSNPQEIIADDVDGADEMSALEARTMLTQLVFEEHVIGKPTFLFSQYKADTITIHPETTVFWTVGILPTEWVGSMVEKAKEKGKETATDVIEKAI